MEAPVIFYEDNERAGCHYKMEFEYNAEDMGKISHVKYYNLIYCINSETYKCLYKTLRKEFLYIRTGHSFERKNTIYNKAVQFIEEKLLSLKEDLPKRFRDEILRKED